MHPAVYFIIDKCFYETLYKKVEKNENGVENLRNYRQFCVRKLVNKCCVRKLVNKCTSSRRSFALGHGKLVASPCREIFSNLLQLQKTNDKMFWTGSTQNYFVTNVNY